MDSHKSETDLLWCFNEPRVVEQFVATCDSDHNEGYSSCGFGMSPAGRGLFHGYLDTRVPKDGRIKKAGYCAIRSQRIRKAFKRESTFNWTIYNTLVLKVRGDGRSYLLNISCEGYYDITWNDIYHYVLYTRGGPYWQIAKIPFSKFIIGSKGRIQDKQTRMRLDKVTHFGITCGDKINGNFNLELEYIGLEFDPTHDEEFAYEMYKTDRYIVGV
ncbi:jg27957 [Pararge aegeria aegeria]|uniref:Jg27957 protein n=1 Tax=Pararge aegeria aegeria TaxID=348720 RepID=A0A8S4S2R2_9NEOP|nr:jg27957 [Pararge aegeria aegeria]